MKKITTETLTDWNYTHVENLLTTPKFSVILGFGVAGRQLDCYPVDSVPAENKKYIDNYYRGLCGDLDHQHDITVYNTWLKRYYPNEQAIAIEMEIIEHQLKLNIQIFDCGHTVESESWICDSPLINWGHGVMPESPYRHDYLRDNPQIDKISVVGICYACRNLEEVKTKTPILVITSDSWSRHAFVIFESDKIIGDLIPDNWIDEKYDELREYDDKITRTDVKTKMEEQFFNENTDVDEFWPQHQICLADDYYYHYFNDGTVKIIDNDDTLNIIQTK